MARITFKSNTIDIGTIQPNSLNNAIDFYYEGESSSIVAIRPLCGCTGQGVIFNDKIQFLFNEEAVKQYSKENLKSEYPNKEYPFTKSIEVYLNDGKDLFIRNRDGIKKYNPEKEMITLTFKGIVDLTNA